jgi:signal transduction histidine kinase
VEASLKKPWLPGLFFTTASDSKRTITNVQWVVVVAISYLAVFENGRIAAESLRYLLPAIVLASVPVLHYLPPARFESRWFRHSLLIVDAIFIAAAAALNREGPWDLLLVFFFGLFIAAIGESLLQAVVGSLVLGVIAVALAPIAGSGALLLSADALFRIPLLFGACLVYGYLAGQIKREKTKVAELEQIRQDQLRVKDQFLSHVSHELRTPLTAIYQFVTILYDGLAGELNTEQREYLSIVLRNAKQLQNMIGELLEATRAEAGKLAIDPRRVVVAETISETLNVLLTTAAAKGITLGADVPGDLPPVYADPQRFKQILTNLIENAVKFTPAHGKIWVGARPYNQDPGFVCVTVSDSGCGISKEGAERIFERLYQEERTLETNRKGLGLGLHICNELISRHGGRIWVESDLGKGSTFYFTLPVFSLANLVAPLVSRKAGMRDSIALISVELLSGQVSATIRETAERETWGILQRFAAPGKCVLLPRTSSLHEAEIFFLLSSGNGEALAQELRDEITRAKSLQEFSIAMRVIDVAPESGAEEGPSGEYIEEICRRVTTLIEERRKLPPAADGKTDRKDYLGIVSRQIRNPLAVVMGYAEILRGKHLGDLNNQQEGAVAKVISHTNDLLVTINNALEARRIETGTLAVEKREVHLGTLLEDLKLLYSMPLDKPLTIHWEYSKDLPVIVTDAGKLRLMLQNLLHYVLKSTLAGKVTVQARGSAGSRSVEIEIASEMDKKLRDGQGQVEISDDMELGLNIVEVFAELLGGKFGRENKAEGGSIFRVRLPAAELTVNTEMVQMR